VRTLSGPVRVLVHERLKSVAVSGKYRSMKADTPTPSLVGRPRSRPTIRHVARDAGVSIATVSGVLTNRPDCRASQETRARVMASAQKLGYRPSLMAHALHGKRTMTIGLVTGVGIAGETWERTVTAFEEYARGQGYLVVNSYSQNTPELEDHVIDELLHRQVDAMAVYPVAEGSHTRLRQIVREGFPVVTFDAASRLDLHADDVSIDQYTGGRLQAEHLLSLGRKRICLVNSKNLAPANVLKTSGFEDALKEAGLKLAGRMNLVNNWRLWSDSNPAVYEEIKQFIASHRDEFDAFAAHGDIMALLTMRACISLGMDVPRQISITGFNDIMAAGLMSPSLTTIKDPADDQGREAARLLLERLDKPLSEDEPPQRISLKPQLVVRGSTARVSDD